ncbi:MAG TPA: dihydrodipicolinate synthase family protein, partial [Saprospiraceae bacterium]|nr:dihydrodipicolinate synthase family protein [Saprospiraceae bacterium]
MNRFRLRGTGVALVTPFKNGKVDFDALENVIEHCIRGGVEFLVSLGTTGEAITLNPKECREVLDFTIKINAGRLPLVVGFF